ncbi:MATE family efflux transporter [Lachnoclostridium phytofermentans]|uniref:Multidrug export protein MepA n=1 Tax=Lachnoclostridium phytofermentans (strain ATCC 700394 / DSM 18823 / ISDg) TaxID=357809 RepID=A9KQQ4_LACP7|nr:MATE family efflux transporter [Lachnoclostridium phytofermentans]ABX41967.1 MATE efflux family protein [Lachnoclostridium phytofermentans ISDg]
MKKTNDLGKDNISSLVFRLAIPTMIAQLVNVLYSIVDRMYIGNIPEIGDIALAGVGVCGPIVTLLSSFGTLVGLGGSILMAMKMGEQKKKEAEQILANSFLMLLILSGTLTLIFLLSKDFLLYQFGASDVTFPYANTYMTIYTAGTFFALLSIGLNYFITCQGYSMVSMTTVIIGAISNIILDSVFVFGFHMGVAGAAIATVIAQMFSCLFALIFLFRKQVPIRITFGGYSKAIMKKIISIGLSPFLILASDSIIIIIMNAVLQYSGGPSEGDLLISAATIVQSYMLLITGPLVGITGGTQAIISYNYGAARADRIKQAERIILMLCLAFTSFMFLVSRSVPQYFVRIFTTDTSLTHLSVWGIKAFTLGVIPLSFQYALIDGLTALGRTKTALALSLFRKSSYVVYMLLLTSLFTAKSAFYAEPLSDTICAIVTTTVFLKVFNKHLNARCKNANIQEINS